MNEGLFVSYRRADTQSATGRLVDHLRQNGFGGRGELFVDIDHIPPGADYRTVINETLARCDLVVVVVGRHWLDSADETGRRRIDDPLDTHRLEVAAALRSEARVVPVRVEGADHPTVEDLPDDLKELSYLQSWELTERSYAEDTEQLAHLLLEARHETRLERQEAVATAGDDAQTEPMAAQSVVATGGGSGGSSERSHAVWRNPWVLGVGLAGLLAIVVVAAVLLRSSDDGTADTEGAATTVAPTSSPTPEASKPPADRTGWPPAAGADPSDRVFAFYYSSSQTAADDPGCCDYYPAYPVARWDDAETLAQHFAWLRQAGIGVIAYSWWGRDSAQDENLPATLDAADHYGIKVAFIIEAYDGRSGATLADDVAYLYEAYGDHSAFFYTTEPTRQQAGTDPKGLFFMWEFGADPTSWKPAIEAIHESPQGGVVLGGDITAEWIDRVGLDGLFNVPDPNLSDFSWSATLPEGAWYVPMVLPGFEQENRGNPYAYEPRRDARTYDEWWQAALGTSTRPAMVGVGTFNYWIEGTQIEPVAEAFTNDQGFTYRDYGSLGPEGYLLATLGWIREFLNRFP